MSSLVSLYIKYVKDKKLVKSTSGEDLTTVLPLLRKVDPKHYLLHDQTVAVMYLEEAEKHLIAKDFDLAAAYIQTGLKFFPKYSRLQSLNKQFNAGNIRK